MMIAQKAHDLFLTGSAAPASPGCLAISRDLEVPHGRRGLFRGAFGGRGLIRPLVVLRLLFLRLSRLGVHAVVVRVSGDGRLGLGRELVDRHRDRHRRSPPVRLADEKKVVDRESGQPALYALGLPLEHRDAFVLGEAVQIPHLFALLGVFGSHVCMVNPGNPIAISVGLGMEKSPVSEGFFSRFQPCRLSFF